MSLQRKRPVKALLRRKRHQGIAVGLIGVAMRRENPNDSLHAFQSNGFVGRAEIGVSNTDRLSAALSGRYRIERELGAGGMATVYLAKDLKHDRNNQARSCCTLTRKKLRYSLPHGPRGDEGAFTAEPRLLADGKTVLVSTFNCGLYLLHGLETAAPSAKLVSSFPRKKDTSCAIPVVAGHYYLVTVPAYSAVVSLDISNPAKPREVSRVAFGKDDVPHWISIEPNHRRVVITGYKAMQYRVVLVNFDEATGQLTLDTKFRDPGAKEPGVRLDNKTWPHGGQAGAVPHGAVFSAESAGKTR